MRNINPNPNKTYIRSISLDTRYTRYSNIFSFPLFLKLLVGKSEEIISDLPT